MHTKLTWTRVHADLSETFQKWNVVDWRVEVDPSLDKRRLQDVYFLSDAQRRVTVRWTTREDHRLVSLSMDEHQRPVDNLNVLRLAIEALRMNEVRGIGRHVRDAYLQLSAAAEHRDPYEVLGVRSDAALEVVEAAYKQVAKMAHPDRGGDPELMRQANSAIEEIRRQRRES